LLKFEKKKKEIKIAEERDKFFEKTKARKDGDYALLLSWY
jgi:hypothetical protein